MPTPAISKQQVLAALTAAAHDGPGPGEGDVVGLSMDELATRAGVSRATLYRLFGNQQHLLHELGRVAAHDLHGSDAKYRSDGRS